MAFSGIGDVIRTAEAVYKVYEYGWKGVYNASKFIRSHFCIRSGAPFFSLDP